jgi:hypothetical protein
MFAARLRMNNKQIFSWVTDTLREAAWAPLCVVGFYAIGLMFHFYRNTIKNSQGMLGNIPLPIQILLAFTATGTTAVFWEFYENIADYFLHTHMVLGLFDTIKDLFDGIMGTLVLSVFYRKN